MMLMLHRTLEYHYLFVTHTALTACLNPDSMGLSFVLDLLRVYNPSSCALSDRQLFVKRMSKKDDC